MGPVDDQASQPHYPRVGGRHRQAAAIAIGYGTGTIDAAGVYALMIAELRMAGIGAAVGAPVPAPALARAAAVPSRANPRRRTH